MNGKLVFGIGDNDLRGSTARSNENYPFYFRWMGILKRISNESIYPSYSDCFICEDWIKLSNFANWMRDQDWKDKCIDKDIIVPGNREYSPEKCSFVSKSLSSAFAKDFHKLYKEGSILPKGVMFNTGMKHSEFNYFDRKYLVKAAKEKGRGVKVIGESDYLKKAALIHVEYRKKQARKHLLELDDMRVATGLIMGLKNLQKEALEIEE